jgi:hypothetical protein
VVALHSETKMDIIWITVFLALFLGLGVWSSLLSRRVGQLEEKLKKS